ncbi:UNVERIFIED_CONTAM: hypothetical protein HHA_452120 [Hammondia hammondi]|eukprot:XP_008885152.1 hypothetical protein HHA_452120 [Hammondia hammondi]
MISRYAIIKYTPPESRVTRRSFADSEYVTNACFASTEPTAGVCSESDPCVCPRPLVCTGGQYNVRARQGP